jgi:hypothetical protein
MSLRRVAVLAALAGSGCCQFGIPETANVGLQDNIEQTWAEQTSTCSQNKFMALDSTLNSIHAYGRLNNQIIQLRNAIYIAHLIGRTFVLPDAAALKCCGKQEQPAQV